MARDATITVKLTGDARDAQRALRDVERSGGRMSSSLKSAGKVAGVALAAGLAVGTAAAVKLGTDAIKSASDLNETLSKSRAIFGQHAQAMETWAKGAATSAGLSTQAALSAAAGFGDMFTQIGFTGKQASMMSRDIVQMSADLGSFNNLDTADVADRMSAAFRGEYDSLQAVIPNINAARVESEALSKTGKRTAKELTAQEKAAAVLAIVHRDGARAMGDFERTSGGLANQQKILSARFENVKAAIGQKLLPFAVRLAKFANDTLLPAMTRFGSYLGTVLPPLIANVASILRELAATFAAVASYVAEHETAFKVLAAVLGTLFIPLLIQMSVQWALATARLIAHTIAAKALAIYMRVMAVATKAWAAAQWLLNIAMTANPVGLIIAGVIALIAVIVLIATKTTWFQTIWRVTWNAIKAVVSAVVGWFGKWVPAVFAFVVNAIKRYVGIYKAVVVGTFRLVKAAVGMAIGALRAVVVGGWRAVTGVVTRGAGTIVSAIRAVPGKIRQAGSLFLGAGKALMGKLIDGLKQVGKVGVDIGRNLFNGIIDGINSAIRGVNDFLPNKIGIPGPVPDIDLPDNPIPTIPRLFRGGITTGPTLAMIGDNPGGREAVIPLDRYPHLLDPDRPIVIHQTIELDGQVIDRRVTKHLSREARKILSGAS